VVSRPRNRRDDGASTTKSSDDGGCVLIALLILWYCGFVSFHWRGEGQSSDRLKDVETQIASAESQLANLSRVVREIGDQSDTLSVRRRTLQDQVAELERTRDEIALSLERASNAVAPSARSRWRSLFGVLFTGVPSNLISSALIASIAWFYGRRTGRKSSLTQGNG
jgi:hypothetical protein